MNGDGLIMMIISYGVVITLTGYCFYRVFATPNAAQDEHALLEIDTRDADPKGSGTSLR